MKPPTREDLELYVIGAYDGDVAALEQYLATNEAARAIVAEEAALEMKLRDAGAAATFCPACDDVVAADQCEACGASVRAGGYAIERVIVQHAHGRMYVARDADRTRVALKELAFVQAPDADAHAAFEREARMLRALEHPAIPRFVASFEEGRGVHTRYYLAQELVDGASLAARLGDHFFDEREIIDIARQVLRVLVYLQNLSPMVVHRDIKPGNLLQRGDGSIAVVDFGAAHVQGATVGSTSIGTFGYMPVEQMVGIVDATTDTYALGASLLHLLTRREPWKLLQQPAWDTVNVSPALLAYLKKLVAAEPRERFASAAVALDALEHLGDQPMLEPVLSATRWMPRFVLAAAAAVALAGVGVGGYMLGFRSVPEPAPAPTGAEWSQTVKFPQGKFPPGYKWPVIHIGGDGPARAAPAKLEAGPTIDLDFKDSDGGDAMRFLAGSCGVGIVMPDSVRFKLTLHATSLPCDQAFEAVLQANGLWYIYEPDVRLVRIGPRRELELEPEEAARRAELQTMLGYDNTLPAGPKASVDFKDIELSALVDMLAKYGNLDVLIPPEIHAKVTVKATTPWNRLLPAVLAAHGLAYRHHGKLLRIGPVRQLDAEDESELARRGH